MVCIACVHKSLLTFEATVKFEGTAGCAYKVFEAQVVW